MGLVIAGNIAQAVERQTDSTVQVVATIAHYLQLGGGGGNRHRGAEGQRGGLSRGVEDILRSSARYHRAILLQGGPHVLGEGGPAGGREAALEGNRVHTGFIDGEGTAPGGVADVCAVGERVFVKDQGAARTAGLGWGGVSGQQGDRRCGACGASGTLGNGKVQNGALGSARVGDLGAGAGIAGGDSSNG